MESTLAFRRLFRGLRRSLRNKKNLFVEQISVYNFLLFLELEIKRNFYYKSYMLLFSFDSLTIFHDQSSKK